MSEQEQCTAAITELEFLTFWDFFQLFIEFNGIDLPLKDFHRELCDALEDAVMGNTEWEWIMVNQPPRTGKTKILEALACWTWAYANDAQMIYTTYASNLVERSMDYVGKTLQQEWYIELFSDHLHSKRLDLMTTVEGGQMHGEGTGGSLTGKGGGLKRPFGGFIAIDDPNKPEEALSLVIAESTKRWLHTTLETRRNSDRWCPIIVAGHRLGPTDLFQYILETYKGKIRHIIVDAVIELADGNYDSLIPETKSASNLNAMKATRYGRYVLDSQYRQKPSALGGNLIDVEAFKRYRRSDIVGARWEAIHITVDTAMKVKQENDFSAGHAWALMDGKVYLLPDGRVHGKWESPQLLTAITAFAQRIRQGYLEAPVRCLIEAKAAGIGLIQQMVQAGVPAEEIERDIDKVRRVQLVLPFIDAGCVYLPVEDEDPWVNEVIAECSAFTPLLNHAHDDDVDCLCDGIATHLQGGRGILDLYG